jgi:hypothetical protein
LSSRTSSRANIPPLSEKTSSSPVGRSSLRSSSSSSALASLFSFSFFLFSRLLYLVALADLSSAVRSLHFFHPVCSSISSPPTARPLPSTRTDQRDRRRRSRRLRRSWESTAKPQIPRSSLAGGRRREGRKEEQGKRICINFLLSHVLLSKVQVPLVQVGFALRRVQL